MEEKHAIEVTDLVISYQNLKKTSIKKNLLQFHRQKADRFVAGFQREMTGRENIILSGMLLGFSEEEVRAKEAEIVEFAELGEFIDMPVRTYSSGMYSKLAFSITAILETDIMLIDEVLSVGDQKFKKKSYNKMKSLISNKERTVIIVSHSIETLQELCDTVMWMHDGQIKRIGHGEELKNMLVIRCDQHIFYT